MSEILTKDLRDLIMNDVSKLQLHKAIRPYVSFGDAHKSKREFLDFVINDISLWEICKEEKLDNISCVWLPKAYDVAIKRLLLQEPPDFPDGKTSIYVCAECGDIGCGAVSVQIEIIEGKVIWSDFLYQNNYDDSMSYIPKKFREFESVVFDLDEYQQLLLPLIT